jgi:prepilin-type N-terminal cleavage/methylation domain-containing protein
MNKRIKRAFTLVELLVIIAIISILASLLLPTLDDALTRATLTLCTNNFRQNYLGYLSYANDNRDHMPAPADGIFLNRLCTYENPNIASGRYTGKLQPLNGTVLVSSGYLEGVGTLLCPDHAYTEKNKQKIEASMSVYEATGTMGQIVDGSYMYRGPAYQKDKWETQIDYYYAYCGRSASLFRNNQAGAMMARQNIKLSAAVAIMADLAPYNSRTDMPHNGKGYAVLFADGVVVQRPAHEDHPFMDPAYNIGSQPGSKIWGCDTQHPSFNITNPAYHDRSVWWLY